MCSSILDTAKARLRQKAYRWLLALLYMAAQHLGIHAAGAYQTQAARIADGAGQLPAAAPDHAGLDDRFLDVK